MVTGFEIFGAVGTCVALLNLARQGYESLAKTYRDYQDAGADILAAQSQCSQIYFIVQAWTTIWGFDIRKKDEFYKACWGEDGWSQIEYQLAVVSIKCADLAAIISKALPETYQKIPEDDVNRARACLNLRLPDRCMSPRQRMHLTVLRLGKEEKVEEIRQLEGHITKSTTRWGKVKYVLSSSKKMQRHLQALQDDFDRLKGLVKAAWQLQYPDVNFKTSTRDERHLAVLRRLNLFLIKEAKEDRVATEELYSWCSDTRRAVKLEMSLLDSTGNSPSKRFHIFVPQNRYDGHLEVSTVILHDDIALDKLKFETSFQSACDVVHKEVQCLLLLPESIQNGSVRSPRELRRRSCFSLRKRATHVGVLDLPSLSDRIDCLVVAERLEIAYGIVETGLLLLGTPWLSDLSNVTLKRFKADEKAPRYILNINQRHNLVRTQLADQGRDLHQYIFIIGISLAEIALQHTIRDLRRSASGFELFVAGPDGLKWRSLGHVISLVNDKLGISYSEAVEFCLQDPVHAPNRLWKNGVLYDATRNEEQICLELLDLFYEKVLIKLEPYHGPWRRDVSFG